MNWLHRLLNPHCESCMDEIRENRICNSCETLKSTVTRLQFENERLLNNLLIKPIDEVKVFEKEELKPIMPNHVPWKVQRQMLEKEDRQKALLMRTKTEELEKELGVNKNVS